MAKKFEEEVKVKEEPKPKKKVVIEDVDETALPKQEVDAVFTKDKP